MTDDRMRLNLSAAGASIAVALALIAIKLWAQLATGSLSIAASLVDSALDLTIALANLAAMLYAARPADDDHRFGHTAAEDVAALAQGALVVAAGIAILWSGAVRLIDPQPLQAEREGVIAMVAALALTGALVWWQRRVARRTGSRIVAADSAHYLSDFAPMLAALVALAASKFLDAPQLDSVLAMAAALWILRTGWRVARGALHGLMDREAPPETVARIAELADAAPGVLGWHDLKTRMSGPKLFVQLHVEIDGSLRLKESHAIGEALRREILAIGHDVDVIIHTDPVKIRD
ncbi:MAG: cation diffusion facilitator family transporter [Rubrimonas sp.]|uniref:cation diffusion facilitator family transporter n=1 Tax=Rubrimonas sp. TaxID=2036015 RepID=UPI002FDCFAB5